MNHGAVAWETLHFVTGQERAQEARRKAACMIPGTGGADARPASGVEMSLPPRTKSPVIAQRQEQLLGQLAGARTPTSASGADARSRAGGAPAGRSGASAKVPGGPPTPEAAGYPAADPDRRSFGPGPHGVISSRGGGVRPGIILLKRSASLCRGDKKAEKIFGLYEELWSVETMSLLSVASSCGEWGNNMGERR